MTRNPKSCHSSGQSQLIHMILLNTLLLSHLLFCSLLRFLCPADINLLRTLCRQTEQLHTVIDHLHKPTAHSQNMLCAISFLETHFSRNDSSNNILMLCQKGLLTVNSRDCQGFGTSCKRQLITGINLKTKCICLNNTNYTGYNKSEICKKLNISRPTLDSYLNQCIDKKLIKEEQNGYTLTNTHLFKIDIVKGKDDDEVYTKVYIPMADFFASQSITIPPYNKKIVGKIIDHYSALPFLAAALKKRKIPEGTVCTWKYLAKVLKVNIVEKPRPIPPKVTLIM